jgi:hypothetical protein
MNVEERSGKRFILSSAKSITFQTSFLFFAVVSLHEKNLRAHRISKKLLKLFIRRGRWKMADSEYCESM